MSKCVVVANVFLFTRSQDVAKPTWSPTPYRYRYRLNELPCIDFAENGPVRINWFMHEGSMLNTLIEILYTLVSKLWMLCPIYQRSIYTIAIKHLIRKPVLL